MSDELRKYLHAKGVATSHTTAYNPQSNGQVERMNGIIWRSVVLALKSRVMAIEQWEVVLPDALHSIRSLLCTATNCTPHERMFHHNRKAATGSSLPSWLVRADKVLLRKQNRASKYDSLVEEVELLECNPTYARIRFQDGREDNVSLRNLAPTAEKSVNPSVDETTKIACPNEQLRADEPLTPDSIENDSTKEQYGSMLQKQQRTHPYVLRNREA